MQPSARLPIKFAVIVKFAPGCGPDCVTLERAAPHTLLDEPAKLLFRVPPAKKVAAFTDRLCR
jgi:hypothetical protein